MWWTILASIVGWELLKRMFHVMMDKLNQD